MRTMLPGKVGNKEKLCGLGEPGGVRTEIRQTKQEQELKKLERTLNYKNKTLKKPRETRRTMECTKRNKGNLNKTKWELKEGVSRGTQEN